MVKLCKVQLLIKRDMLANITGRIDDLAVFSHLGKTLEALAALVGKMQTRPLKSLPMFITSQLQIAC